MFTAMMLVIQAQASINSLEDYLKLDTGKPIWSVGPSTKDLSELRLTSLTWQGNQWRHEIVIAGSKLNSDVAILNLTGDRMENRMDDFTRMFSQTCHLPVVTVYGVPNQPLFGLREDELMARAMVKFFTTQDNTWHPLLPMAKSAVLAMDAIQAWSKGRINKFIVTGTSKRGATSWLTAETGDPRVIGIAPTVADLMMDMTRQLETQRAEWGHFSPMMPDMQQMDPLPFFKAARGKQMFGLADPYFSLSKVKVPVLVIGGTNDVFCTVDATKLYWDAIKVPKLFKIIPNATHFFAIPNAMVDGYSKEMSLDAMRSIRYFADCITGKDKQGLPSVANLSDSRRRGTKTWSVGAETPWVQESRWQAGPPPETAKFTASFEEVNFEGDGYTASFTTLVSVKKR